MNINQKLSLNRSLSPYFSSPSVAQQSVPDIRIQLFGKFEIWINDQKLEVWPTRRAKHLLAYLLLHHKKPQSRDILIEKFWPHSTPDTARNSLNVAIHAIRKAFKKIDSENDYIIFRQDHYSFNPKFELISDVDIFNDRWREGKYLTATNDENFVECFEEAISTYQGIFLAENLYDTWADEERNYMQEAYLSMQERLCEYYIFQGNFIRCIELCEQILQVDNCREDIYRKMMEAYIRQGKRTKAIRLYYRCVESLASELDIMPTEETRKLFKEIRMG